ncbi:MAG: hypothetical protein PHX62_04550, partial [Bacilli bacterium]|nr:hypothetical protein [Bacilli bacterium]
CSPTDPEYFTYCGWGYWPAHQRVWGCNLEGTEGGALGAEKPNEHRTHEYFTADGKRIAYHGKFFKMVNGKFRKFKDTFGIMNADGSNDISYVCPVNYRGAGHSSMSIDQSLIIGDGELDGIGFISKLTLNDENMTVEVEPIFRHDSSMAGNFEHPHPSISQDKKYVCFVTDFKKTRKPKFYLIDMERK